MKLKVNTEIIRALNPCKDRFDNYLVHYANFEGDIRDFLVLENITPKDKVWVAVRIMPRDLVEIFAIDAALHASHYATYTDAENAENADNYAIYTAASYAADVAADVAADTYAANANYAAYATANYAAYASDADAYAERARQIDCLDYLIANYNPKGGRK